MEPLIAQLKKLPARFAELSQKVKLAIYAAAAVVVLGGVAAALVTSTGAGYQYVFSNLQAEDQAAASGILKAAGIPFRVEAGGEAIAVPADKVYDARLMLAAQGIPRAAGVGFELFDKSDIGVSSFTQKVNLRRATEGELARTISGLGAVQSARVHVTLPKKSLFKDDDHPARASVVVRLHAGRSLEEGQVAGIRHLVSSAVPGLTTEGVTVVDGRGTVLSTEEQSAAQLHTFRTKMERDLEARVVSLLEPATGAGAVVARVTADVDFTQVQKTEKLFDGENPVLKSERKRTRKKLKGKLGDRGLTGAEGNTPRGPPPKPVDGTDEADQDETRSFEISNTVTRTVQRNPRVTRLSIAVLVDKAAFAPPPAPKAKEGEKAKGDEKAAPVVEARTLTPEELARLEQLAKRAVGFDEKRGDRLEIHATRFAPRGEEGAVVEESLLLSPIAIAAMAGAALLLVVVVIVVLKRRKASLEEQEAKALLSAGGRVDEIEEAMRVEEIIEEEPPMSTPEHKLLDRAKELANEDPARAAHLLHAWLEADRAQLMAKEEIDA